MIQGAMMHRRFFLSLPIMVTTVACAKKDDSWLLIEDIQEHLFPKTKRYPSAKDFKASRYLKMVAYHDSFDKDDLDFILRGVKEVQKQGYKTILTKAEKESVLQRFQESRFGENWISLIINYALEALFSDPLYGGNKAEIGWKTFHHKAGVPRPTKRFGAKHV